MGRQEMVLARDPSSQVKSKFMNTCKALLFFFSFMSVIVAGDDKSALGKSEMIYKLPKAELLRALFELEKVRKLLVIESSNDCVALGKMTDSPVYLKPAVRGSVSCGQNHPLDVLPKEYVEGYFVEKAEKLSIVCPEDVKTMIYKEFHGSLVQAIDGFVRDLEQKALGSVDCAANF